MNSVLSFRTKHRFTQITGGLSHSPAGHFMSMTNKQGGKTLVYVEHTSTPSRYNFMSSIFRQAYGSSVNTTIQVLTSKSGVSSEGLNLVK